MDALRKLEAELAKKSAARIRIEAEERELRASIASLRRLEQKGIAATQVSRGRHLTPQSQAGRYAHEAHKALRRASRPLSQKEIGERGGIGTGTLTHSIQALVSDGLVEPTGEKRGRSIVYRLTEKGSAGMLPRVTRRPPGS